jgi:peptidoglycan/LPS O-acetylase OafA/YrhL
MTAPVSTGRLGHRPELDGVRGLAVLAIFLTHLSYMAPWFTHVARGGILWVDVFFVLSGMLITEILVADFERNGVAELRSFYRRRALRLLPALVFFTLATLAYYQVVHGTGHSILRGMGSVVSYVTTGHFLGPWPPGVSQAWTVVVEWVFYLIWPPVLVLLMRRGLPVRKIGYLALGTAIAVGLARAVLFRQDGGNYILSYHLAWLRFEDLLGGCAIGLLGARPQTPNWVRSLAVVLVIAGTSRVNPNASWVYYYGLLIAAAASVVIVQPRQSPWWFDRVLTWRPVHWLGTVSYSFYLWSVFTISEVSHNLGSWPLLVRGLFAVIVSLALAWASFELIEQRFRVRSRRAPPQALRCTHVILNQPARGDADR